MRIVISNATGDILSQEIIDTKGKRVSVNTTHKKNFLKENCAASAAPNVQDVTTMTPQAAYDAGRNDAINEIMEMISGMITGEVPIDVALPAELAGMAQLQEDDDWIQDAEEDIERRGTEGVCNGDKFGGPTCRKGTKRYNLAKTFRKMAKDKKK